MGAFLAFMLWISRLISLWSKNIPHNILILWNLFWSVMAPNMWILCMHLKRMCSLQLLSIVFCKCQFVQDIRSCHLDLLYRIFCLLVLAVTERGLTKSPTLVMDLSIFLFCFQVYIFWSFVINCEQLSLLCGIDIFYHYKMSLLISTNFSWSLCYLMWL